MKLRKEFRRSHVFYSINTLMALCLIGIISVESPATPAPEPQSLSQYGNDKWREDDGLPQNSVTAIAQAPDGYLWMGTQEGLVRFDGVTFDVYDKNTMPGLPVNDITSLLFAKDGSLWIGTRGGGVVHKQEGTLTTYRVKNGLANDLVLTLCETKAGDIWVGTENGLSRIHNGKISSYSMNEGLLGYAVSTLCEDHTGMVWIGTGRGLNIFRNDSLTTLPLSKELDGKSVWSIYEDKNNTLWLGFGNNGLAQWNNGIIARYSTNDGLSSNSVRSIVEDSENNLWLGTYGGGIDRLKNGTFSSFRESNGLSSSAIASLFVDSEGSVWVGTDGAGLNRLKQTKFHSYGRPEGLSSDYPMAVMEDRAGNLWIGTAEGTLDKYSNGKFTSYSGKDGLPASAIHSLYEDRSGTLWVGTFGSGLYKMQNGKISNFIFSKDQEVSPKFISGMADDGDGGMWIATRGGLFQIKNGVSNYLSSEVKFSSTFLISMLRDSKGNLWLGTGSSGVDCYSNGKVTNYSMENGLKDNTVWAIYEDVEGTIWIGTNSGGLSRFKNGSWQTFTVKNGLYDDRVFSILEDDLGNLWMSSNKGVFHVSKKDLENISGNPSGIVSCRVYGRADGMRSRECNGGLQPAACKTGKGVLWYPTVAGVTFVDPGKLEPNPHAPRVSLEKFFVDQQPVDPLKHISLSPGKVNYEFQYTGLSYLAPDKVQFKYRLEGFDKDWVDAGSRRTAFYTNLPPGNYTFHVIASNSDGVWNEKGAVASFTLAPYFYQTFWFYGICLISFSFVGLGMHKVRTKQIRTKELVHLVEERTKDLLDEKEKTENALVEIKNAQKKIREQAEVLNRAQEAIFVCSTDGTIQFWNKGAERLYGWTEEETIGKKAEKLLFSEESGVHHEPYQGIGEKGEWSGELHQCTRDKRNIIVQSHWSKIDEGGLLKSILVINMDITERKKMETQFLRAQRMQSLGTLAGGIAHDLNNVLTPILVSIELLRLKIEDESCQRALQTMESSAQRGAGIIKQVLAFSRGMEGERDNVQMKYIVSELEKMIKETFPRSIRVKTNVPKDLWEISGDPTQLYQIMMNLCVNARDAMPQGGDLIISAENKVLDEHYARTHQDAHPGNYVMMTVIDTGTGIPNDVIDKIFEPFFTTKQFGQGTGLGLSTLVGIVKSHGGFVNVYSELEKGTRFDVYLPAEAATVEHRSEDELKKLLPKGNGELVLLVDDEAAIREAHRSILEAFGYHVIAAGDGSEAVKLMNEYRGKVKLVLTDMMMPVMDGMATIKHLKKFDPSLKFVAVSGLMGDQKVAEISTLGGVVFLQKPFTTEKLLNTLQQTLSRN